MTIEITGGLPASMVKELYQCPSYYDDTNTLVDCLCGKCQ